MKRMYNFGVICMNRCRIIRSIMALFVCCLFIAGCGSNSDNGDSNGESKEQVKTFLVGEQAIIKQDVAGAVKRSDYNILESYNRFKNENAICNMQSKGQAALLSKDNIVEIKEVEDSVVKVLILSGKQTGRELYVSGTDLEKGERANSVIAKFNETNNVIAVKKSTVDSLRRYLKRQGFDREMGWSKDGVKRVFIDFADNASKEYVINVEMQYREKFIDSCWVNVVLGQKVDLDHRRLTYLYGFLKEAFGKEFSDAIKTEISTSFAHVKNKKIESKVINGKLEAGAEVRKVINGKNMILRLDSGVDGISLSFGYNY